MTAADVRRQWQNEEQWNPSDSQNVGVPTPARHDPYECCVDDAEALSADAGNRLPSVRLGLHKTKPNGEWR